MTGRSFIKYWERFWFGGISPVRPYLLRKIVYIILAFDCWVLLARRGWHYGLDGFNVAHFSWLDAIQPVPGPGLYVGIVILTGVLSFTAAFAKTNRLVPAAIALMYTYGWAMSMIDSYQHHYLISLILVALIFFPSTSADDLYGEKGESHRPFNHNLTVSWGYVLLAANISIVYFFTAIAKIDSEWSSGSVLRSMTEIQGPLSSFEFKLANMGISLDAFWKVLALSVIVGELALSALYILSVFRDRVKSRIYTVTMWAALLIATGFHIGLELFDLKIGWFSFYMVSAACIYFLPYPVLVRTGEILTLPERKIRGLLNGIKGLKNPAGSLVLSILSIVIILYTGYMLELPGGVEASIVASSILLTISVFSFVKKEHVKILKYVITISTAFVIMWTAVFLSDARFSYYSGLGVYNLRRNQLESALENLQKANLYEREEDREKQKMREKLVEELKKKLGK